MTDYNAGVFGLWIAFMLVLPFLGPATQALADWLERRRG